MEFRELLKSDIERTGCSLSELSRASGLSSAVISRYRSGERIPRPDSEMLKKLCDGLDRLEEEAGLSPLGEERLRRYRAVIGNKPSLLPSHLNDLLEILNLSMKDFSNILNYDASYLSRIRSGKRTPADPVAFAEHVARTLNETLRPADRALVSELTGSESEDDFLPALVNWLVRSTPPQKSDVEGFLNSISSFDINQYFRSLNVSPSNFEGDLIQNSDDPKYYYNVDGLERGELSFFLSVLNSASTGPIYMCNDIPLEDMSKDIDFVKQWMELVVRCLKKGHEIHVIHNINRSFTDMLVGLETWIPIYMTGQVHPYYLTSHEKTVYHHSLYVSDTCVLRGESIGQSAECSSSVLSAKPEQIAYGSNRMKQLFTHSAPLMKISRGMQSEAESAYFRKECSGPGSWTVKSCVPAFFALDHALLSKILEMNHAGPDLQKRAESFLASQKEFLNELLQTGSCTMELIFMTKEEFDCYTPELDAPFLLPEESLNYSWETYQEHLRLTKECASANAGLSVRECSDGAFRNLSIYVRDHNLAIVARQKNPRIIFLITHPNMVRAISQFTAPVVES